MSNEKYISYLKEQYLDRVRPLKTVNEVIDMLKNEMEIIPIKESDLSEFEEPHFKFMRDNYSKNINNDISKLNFEFFVLKKNAKSKYYYNLMQNEKERIIIVIELKANFIASNCNELLIDLQIERGIDKKHIELETLEFIEYLSLFEFKDSF